MIRRLVALSSLSLLVVVSACGDEGSSGLDSLPILGTDAPTTLPFDAQTTTTTVVMGEQTYTIQQGDTLSYIAGQFGVTVEALVAANGLANPDAIQAGQKVIIPSGGVLPTTAAPTTSTSSTTAAP
ncbi:MAG: LysM peptidoglycan-binding domain-containing protein [Actinomycetota bacterium]